MERRIAARPLCWNPRRAEVPRDHTPEIVVEGGERPWELGLSRAKRALDHVIELALDEARRSLVRFLEAFAVAVHLLAQRAEFGGDLVQGASPVVDAPELRLELRA